MSSEEQEKKICNEELIAAVRLHECLYVKKHQDYKNKKVRDAAWEKIAELVDNSPYDCKTRWRSLCDRNRKEMTECSGTYASSRSRKPWKLKEAMAFVNECAEVENAITYVSYMPEEQEPMIEIEIPPRKRKKDDPKRKCDVKKTKFEQLEKSTSEDESFFGLLRAKLARLSAEEKDEVQLEMLSLVVNKIKNKCVKQNQQNKPNQD